MKENEIEREAASVTGSIEKPKSAAFRGAAATSLLLLVSFNIYLFVWLGSTGSDQHLLKYETFVPAHLEKLDAADPSLSKE